MLVLQQMYYLTLQIVFLQNNKGINGAIGVIQQVNSYINVTHSVFVNNTDYYGNTIVNGGSRGTSLYDYNWWGK